MNGEEESDIFSRLHPDIKWSQDDVSKLLKLITVHIPEKENHSFISTTKKLPWEKIAFDDHTEADCENMWNTITNKIRKYRLLSEMVTDAQYWIEHPWEKFGRSAAGHPDKPKRALTPFQNFLKNGEKSPRMPDETFGDYIKRMRIVFENLPDKKKEKLIEKAKLDKEEYTRKLNQFLKENPSEAIKKEKKTQLHDIGDDVKYSAFKMYLDETVPETQKTTDMPLDEIVSICHKKWEELSNEEKLSWFKKAKKQSEKPDLKKKKITRKMNLYSYFVKKTMKNAEVQQMPSSIRMKEVSIIWKNLSKKEKQDILQEYNEVMGADDVDKSFSDTKQVLLKDVKIEENNHKPETSTVKNKKKRSLTETSSKTEAAKKALINENIHATSSPIVLKQIKEESDTEDYDSPRKKMKNTSCSDIENNEMSPIITSKKSFNTSIQSNDLSVSDEGSSLIKKKKKEILLQSILARAPVPPPEEPMKLFKLEMKKLKIKYKTDEELAEAWSNLPTEERKKYKKLFKKKKNDYETEYEEFISSLSEKEVKLYTKSQNIAI